jgi:Holliday junction DNA helicase RuvA
LTVLRELLLAMHTTNGLPKEPSKQGVDVIVGIEGKVEHKEPTLVHVNTGGLIYAVHLSIHASNAITDSHVRLRTTQIIRDDAHRLYGFVDPNEQKMFETLLKINGVGPKVALAICSTFSPETFAKVVADKDVAMLKRVPGIGPKAASRILVELADFIVHEGTSDAPQSGAHSEAAMALESLGFKRDAIARALEGLDGDTSALVKAALKRLQRL